MSTQTNPIALNKSERKIIRLAALGGMLEFYDFIIYGVFSVYFAGQFFPSGNPILSVIKTLSETSDFKKIKNKPAFPLFSLLRYHFPEVLIGTSITAIMSGLVVVAIVFMPTYLNEMLHVDNDFISQSMPLVMLCNLITIYYTGKLATRVNPLTILFYLLLLGVVFVPCSYWLISKMHLQLFAGLIMLSILEGMAALLIPMLLSSLFSAPIRLTGVAFCYNVGFTLFGGIAPVLISTLINLGYNVYLTPLIYLLTIIAICGLGLRLLNRSAYVSSTDGYIHAQETEI